LLKKGECLIQTQIKEKKIVMLIPVTNDGWFKIDFWWKTWCYIDTKICMDRYNQVG